MGLLNDFVQTNAQVKAWDRANDAIQKETEHELAVQKGEAEPNEYEEISSFSDSIKNGGVDGKIEFDKPQKKPINKFDKVSLCIIAFIIIGAVIFMLLR